VSIRNDVTVNWNVSPRIITVASPSTEITVQDLHDTCRDLEEKLDDGLQFEHLIDSAGKEPLGGGVLVGITSTLNNARVAFTARGGPSWELMTITGGNCVATDASGSELDPREPTAFTSVDRTLSSSATLIEQTSIQFSSFSGHVDIDAVSGTAGTTFPAGTAEQPVNTVADALTIAVERGLKALHFLGTYVFDGTEDVSGYTLQGSHAGTTVLVMPPNTITDATVFEGLTVTGNLYTALSFDDCFVNTVTFQNPSSGSLTFKETGFRGTTTLNSGSTAEIFFFNCMSTEAGSATPIFNINNSQGKIQVRRWAGGSEWRGITNGQPISMDYDSGHCVVASDCSSGSIIVRGEAKLTDNSQPSMTVYADNLIQSVAPLFNKTITDPVTGIETIYDAEGSGPLYTANIWKDASGSIPYTGTGVERRDHLERQ
jgi:hypothetical protein